MIYTYKNKQLEENKNIGFVNEKALQTFFEDNMRAFTGYKFISTEFSVGNYRLDSVAYDEEANAFVIVEYKNCKNDSLVDQG